MSHHYTLKIIICSVLSGKKKPHQQFQRTWWGGMLSNNDECYFTHIVFSNSRGLIFSISQVRCFYFKILSDVDFLKASAKQTSDEDCVIRLQSFYWDTMA